MGRKLSHADNQQLRDLHASGLTDAQIARRMGITLSAAWARRERLGLARNDNPEVHRQRCREAIKRRVRRDRVSMGQLYAGHLRCEAALRGWYGADSPAQCEILDLLQERGPLTATEIRDALGYSTAPSMTGAKNGAVYRMLRRLKAAGLVEVVGVRNVNGKRRGSWLYGVKREQERANRGV